MAATLTEAQLLELETIRKKNGGILQPEAVARFAENPDTALHDNPEFVWDDKQAAREHRIEAARRLIRVAVHLEPRINNQPVRMYVSLEQDRHQPGGGYRLLDDVLRTNDYRKALLAEARAEMKRFRLKYNHLKELAEVVESMQKAEKDLDSLEKKHGEEGNET